MQELTQTDSTPTSMAMEMKDTKLNQLRESLTALQRAVLDKAWMHLAESGKPISQRVFFHAFPREEAEPALEQLGGKIIIQSYSEGVSSFVPTLLGALLTSSGETLESTLQRCLPFVRDEYEIPGDFIAVE